MVAGGLGPTRWPRPHRHRVVRGRRIWKLVFRRTCPIVAAPVAPEKNITEPAPALPGITLLIAVVAVVVFLVPAVSGGLIYDRALLLHGEIWRAWTAHVVHFGSSHLFWNLAVFLAAGCWAAFILLAKRAVTRGLADSRTGPRALRRVVRRGHRRAGPARLLQIGHP